MRKDSYGVMTQKIKTYIPDDQECSIQEQHNTQDEHEDADQYQTNSYF